MGALKANIKASFSFVYDGFEELHLGCIYPHLTGFVQSTLQSVKVALGLETLALCSSLGSWECFVWMGDCVRDLTEV